MKSEILFWTALVLIVEPSLMMVWPRIRASLFLSYPYRDGHEYKIRDYFNELDKPFRIMCPFRIKARRWMFGIGIVILIVLTTNLMYNLNKY